MPPPVVEDLFLSWKQSFCVFGFIGGACFSVSAHIMVHVCLSVMLTPSTTLHHLNECPRICLSAHCFYATLSEAPSGLDNTSLLLLSVSKLLTLSFTLERERRSKKKEKGVGSGNNRLLSQEGLRKKEQGVRKEEREI